MGRVQTSISNARAGYSTISEGTTITITGDSDLSQITSDSFTKLGTHSQGEYIDFEQSNEINTHINNTKILSVLPTGIDITGNVTTSGDTTATGYKLNKTAGGGDVTIEFQQGGTTTYTMGIDDSDSEIIVEKELGRGGLTGK